MNTISSLFKWIGTTIGANPETLKTQNKTIVGAINEVKGAIVVDNVDKDNISISANDSKTDISFAATKSGYTPIGVVGFAVGNASSSGSGASSANVYRLRVNSGNVVASIKNTSSSAIKIRLYAYVIYRKN